MRNLLVPILVVAGVVIWLLLAPRPSHSEAGWRGLPRAESSTGSADPVKAETEPSDRALKAKPSHSLSGTVEWLNLHGQTEHIRSGVFHLELGGEQRTIKGLIQRGRWVVQASIEETQAIAFLKGQVNGFGAELAPGDLFPRTLAELDGHHLRLECIPGETITVLDGQTGQDLAAVYFVACEQFSECTKATPPAGSWQVVQQLGDSPAVAPLPSQPRTIWVGAADYAWQRLTLTPSDGKRLVRLFKAGVVEVEGALSTESESTASWLTRVAWGDSKTAWRPLTMEQPTLIEGVPSGQVLVSLGRESEGTVATVEELTTLVQVGQRAHVQFLLNGQHRQQGKLGGLISSQRGKEVDNAQVAIWEVSGGARSKLVAKSPMPASLFLGLGSRSGGH